MAKKVEAPQEPVENQNDFEDGAAPEEVTPSASASALPDGAVMLSKEEHNRMQAENRRLARQLKKRDEADAERKRQEEIDAAKAAGDFDKALETEREEKAELKRELDRRAVTGALRDEIAERGYTGVQAKLVRRLVDADTIPTDDGQPDLDALATALDAVEAEYGNVFTPASDEETEVSDEPKKRVRRSAGPTNPDGMGNTPEGYVSPEEYMATPLDVRQSPAFRRRVELSRPYWPKKVPASTFAQSS